MKHFTLPKDGGLIETGLPLGILHSYEKISAEIRTDMDINEFMSIVMAIESQSDHAIARAILHDDRVTSLVFPPE